MQNAPDAIDKEGDNQNLHIPLKSLLPFSNFIKLSDTIFKFVNKLMGDRVIDVGLHIPFRFEKRTYFQSLKDIQEKTLATLYLKVLYHIPRQRRSRQPFKIILEDDFGQKLEVIYFKGNEAYYKKLFVVGEKVLISGEIEVNNHLKSPFFAKLSHPDFVGSLNDKPLWVGEKPIYPLTSGLAQNFIQRFIQKILTYIEPFPDWVNAETKAQLSLPEFDTALKKMHQVPDEVLNSLSPSQRRLCFDEFLAHQLALVLASRQGKKNAIIKKEESCKTVVPFESVGLIDLFLKHLPFLLTEGQKKVIQEIVDDFEKETTMVRLLQGDVGSGKTIVAFISALYQIEKGGQVAILAPTEILAQQHFETFLKLFSNTIQIEILTARHTKKQRDILLTRLKNHEIDLLVGTHALIQQDVIFKNLTYCVIDEQHRFGVEQRVNLYKKGENVHLLSMTATPIPRSLTLAQYGDMDVSLLKEKPKGRKPIVTSLLSQKKLDTLLSRLLEKMKQGEQVYWICPLIEENKESVKTAAEVRVEVLKDYFKDFNVTLVHGKMKPQQKDEAMMAFKNNQVQLLVSTTVIEVGVDVPNASIMVIENAEQFGLAQLHQLRGRVGRGIKDSYCILVFGPILTEYGKKRLEVMKSTNDGFLLAEMDLKLRGSGEIVGTQQSGMPTFKFSNLEKSTPKEQDILNDLLEKANLYAFKLLFDPSLLQEKEYALTYLLPIFKKEEALTYTKSG
ncbi:MAG: ATP-dependent DNA helicase RecG [Proteobacteria bacterium]|nr:ATP-dependent DNA helicase RecG [Pseudomonadota bacterium]